MDIRYSCNQKDFKRYTTEETRAEFLIENLYVDDQVVGVYSHVDRMVTFGCKPVNEAVPLDKGIDSMKTFGTTYVLERREIGIFNIGGAGSIEADGESDLVMEAGNWAVFYPNDIHRPCCLAGTSGKVRKVVVKIRL